MGIKWRIHPSTYILAFFYILTEQFAFYFVIVISLILHEMGHLLVAKLYNIAVEEVCFYMYGGEIRFRTSNISWMKQSVIAIGGIVASAILLLVFTLVDTVFSDYFIKVQLAIIAMNMLPIWPLDGGRIVCFTLLHKFPNQTLYRTFIEASFVTALVCLLLAIFYLKHPFIILLFTIVLWQLVDEKRHLRLRLAYENVVLNKFSSLLWFWTIWLLFIFRR